MPKYYGEFKITIWGHTFTAGIVTPSWAEACGYGAVAYGN